jgi:hypothetical protein
MTTPFAQHIQADGSSRWWQAVPGRYVDPGQYQLVEWLAAGGVPEVVPYTAPPEPEPELPVISKLSLRRALRSRGLEPALDAMLAADAAAAKDWADARELRLDDPLVATMLPAFRAAAGLTDAQVAALIEEARA